MTQLRELMTRELLTLSPDHTMREATRLLAEHHVSGAPVLDGERPVGLLTTTDILEFLADLGGDPGTLDGSTDHNVLDDHTVEEAMTRGELHSLPSSASALAAAHLMRELSIHRVFVVDDARLVGVVSALDLARAMADGLIVKRTLVFPHATRTN